jgi:molybdate transport system substrate-binding protein
VKRYWIFLLAVTLILTACGSATPTAQPTSVQTATPEPHTLTVFAAASLTDAFIEIGQNFEAVHPGVTVTFNFAGSQALRTQIEQGAIADVFASANTKEMDTLVTDNLVPTDTAQIFLTNSLLVILPASNPAHIQTLEDLSIPGIKLVLAAEDVPAGKYARQVLDNLNSLYGTGYKDAVLANVVSNEDNVKQVVTKVQLGEADAGIVYVSDAVAAPDLQTIPIMDEYNVIAKYPIAILSSAPESELAAVFVDYVLSAEGQAILQKWGFTPIHQ